MNNWGIPDWKSAESYGATKSWSTNRWRWEFMRRRQDLRDAFDQSQFNLLLSSPAVPAAGNGGSGTLGVNDPGFLVLSGSSARFGYTHLPNPRISEQPLGVLLFIAVDEVKCYPADFDLETGAPLEDGEEVAIVFNLANPLSVQLAQAKRQLDSMQERRHGKRIQKRSHPKQWLTYLRALDAREAGATWIELTTVLTPHTRGTEQNARDTYEQADRLRYNF